MKANLNEHGITAFVAPFEKENIPNGASAHHLLKHTGYAEFINTAKKIASELSIEIIEISHNLGGYMDKEFYPICEPSAAFRFPSSVTEQEAETFAVELGKNAIEKQHTVRLLWDVGEDIQNANALEYEFQIESIERCLTALWCCGIANYTINIEKKILSIIYTDDFDDEEKFYKNIQNLTSSLNALHTLKGATLGRYKASRIIEVED